VTAVQKSVLEQTVAATAKSDNNSEEATKLQGVFAACAEKLLDLAAQSETAIGQIQAVQSSPKLKNDTKVAETLEPVLDSAKHLLCSQRKAAGDAYMMIAQVKTNLKDDGALSSFDQALEQLQVC